MSASPDQLFPEDLEFDLEQAYPGLPPHAYQSIAYESLHRHTGGEGGREWAMNTTRLSQLEMRRTMKTDPDDIWNS